MRAHTHTHTHTRARARTQITKHHRHAAAQACHELVPPEALAPVLRQLVDQFVHDRWGLGRGGAGCSLPDHDPAWPRAAAAAAAAAAAITVLALPACLTCSSACFPAHLAAGRGPR